MATPDPARTVPQSAPGSTVATVPPEDRAKYIRTMAGDMAALSGGAVLPEKQRTVETSEPQPTTTTHGGVTLEEHDAPFFERITKKREEERAPESIPSREALSDVFDSARAPAPSTLPAPAEPLPAEEEAVVHEHKPSFFERMFSHKDEKKRTFQSAPPAKAPAEVHQEAPVPQAPLPSADLRAQEERDAVLERLRQKVLANAPAPSQPLQRDALAAMPATISPEPISPPPAPPVLPTPPAPKPLPQPAAIPQPLPQPVEAAPPAPAPIVSPPVPPEPIPPSPFQFEPLPNPSRVSLAHEAPLHLPGAEWATRPEPIPPPLSPEPKVVIPEPRPTPDPIREPIPEPSRRMPEFPPLPARAEPLPLAYESLPQPKPLPRMPASMSMHTYGTDFADRVDASGASAFSVLAAEQDSRPRIAPAPVREGAGRALTFAAVAIVVIGLAGSGGYMAYQYISSLPGSPSLVRDVPSLVFAVEYRELKGSGPELVNALASTAATLMPDTALVTFIADPNATSSPLAPAAGGATFLRAMGVPAPDSLLRNINETSTIGAIEAGGQSKAFFALRVDSYARTYAGMLDWEPLMREDLEPLYPLYPADAPAAAPLQATSTVQTGTSTAVAVLEPQVASARSRFEDDIVANRDVRVLRDTRGRSLVLYGYSDKQTLLIARDEAAFEALIARLRSE